MIRVIAEIGINHDGDFERALQLQNAAAEAGCWAVKYQIRTNFKECVPEFLWDTTRRWRGSDLPYFEYRRRLEFDDEQLRDLYDHAKSIGLEWFASPWDVESVGRLAAIERDYCKVASAMVTNKPLLRAIADAGFARVFLSTGMSYASEVNRAYDTLWQNASRRVVLMACISAYPCPDDALNLNRVRDMQEEAGWAAQVGYSGHERDILPSLIAVGLGATYIERHLTYSKSAEGSDHAASLEPHEMAELVRQAQRVESMLGSGDIKPLPEEEPAMRKLRKPLTPAAP